LELLVWKHLTVIVRPNSEVLLGPTDTYTANVAVTTARSNCPRSTHHLLVPIESTSILVVVVVIVIADLELYG
jgi:hypothetical protein